MNKRFFSALPVFLVLGIFLSANNSSAADCKKGYEWKPRTGIGCVQKNCNDIPNAHYGYVGDCVCGSSGSINENPKDPNKECRHSHEYAACPGCVYACVGIDEECPDAPGEKKPDDETKNNTPTTSQNNPQDSSNSSPAANGSGNKNPTVPQASSNNQQPSSLNNNIPLQSSANAPALTTKPTTKRTCQQECEKFKEGGNFDQVLEVSGEYPDCKCVVDVKDELGRITKTINKNGDKITTYVFDPEKGTLKNKNTISLQEERERIRERLGYRYTEEEIDALLEEDKINKWFEYHMRNIDTRTNLTDPQFWWQHFVALLDHGHGNSADFVDVHNFGRCGDSMMWLEDKLKNDLKLTTKNDKPSEAMLSITGEKYGNFINHTALMIRPSGISNIEWADMVKTLTDKSGQKGMSKNDLKNVDPRLLKVKVLDPYFKKVTTVEKFIEGWSVIKIS